MRKITTADVLRRLEEIQRNPPPPPTPDQQIQALRFMIGDDELIQDLLSSARGPLRVEDLIQALHWICTHSRGGVPEEWVRKQIARLPVQPVSPQPPLPS